MRLLIRGRLDRLSYEVQLEKSRKVQSVNTLNNEKIR